MKFNPLETLKIVSQLQYLPKELEDGKFESPEDALCSYLEKRFSDWSTAKQFKYCLAEFDRGTGTYMVSDCGRHLYSIRQVLDAYLICELEPVTDPLNNLRSGCNFSEFEVYLLTNGRELTNSMGFKYHKDLPHILNPDEYKAELEFSEGSTSRKNYLKEAYKTITV